MSQQHYGTMQALHEEQQIVIDFFAIYTSHAYEKIPTVIDANYKDNSPAQARGPEDVVKILQTVAAIFPDLSYTILDMFTDNDRVATRIRFSGTHSQTYIDAPASGKIITWEALEHFSVKHGKIVESWGYWPDYDMLRQMKGDR